MRCESSEVNWIEALNQTVKPSAPSSVWISVVSDCVSDCAGHHCISQHMPAEQRPVESGGRLSQSASIEHFFAGEVQLLISWCCVCSTCVARKSAPLSSDGREASTASHERAPALPIEKVAPSTCVITWPCETSCCVYPSFATKTKPMM